MCQAVVTVHVQLLGVSVCVCFVVASATMHPFPVSQPGDDDDDDDHRDDVLLFFFFHLLEILRFVDLVRVLRSKTRNPGCHVSPQNSRLSDCPYLLVGRKVRTDEL